MSDQAANAGTELSRRLSEREKELDALYRLAALLAHPSTDVGGLASDTARILADSMQYPECVAVDLRAEGVHVSNAFPEPVAAAYRTERVYGRNKTVELSVSYHALPGLYGKQLVFDVRETHLIDAVSALLAQALDHVEVDLELYKSTEDLKYRTNELEKKNIALREVLSQIEAEKHAILKRVETYLDVFVMPYLYQLSNSDTISAQDRSYVEQLSMSLQGLFTGDSGQMLLLTRSLTPRELEICGLIRNGMTTKEISAFLHIADSTVERHRNTIRRKLHIAGEKVNLTSYLRASIDTR